MEKVEKGVEIKYKDLSSFEFNQVVMKIKNAQTTPQKANHIRQIVKRVNALQDKARKEYVAEILEKYFEKDEKGEFKRPEGDPQGYIPVKDKEEELKKAEADFQERTGTIDWAPMPLSTLSDVKVSGNDLIALDLLITEDPVGPGIPEGIDFPAPQNLRKMGRR